LTAPRRAPLQVWTDRFPLVSETFVAEECRRLRELGHEVEIVAGARAHDPASDAGDLPVRYLGEESFAQQLLALVRLVARNPRAWLRDRRDRRRWAAEEPVAPLRVLAPHAVRLAATPGARMHVHFAAGAALSALRVARLVRRPWSLTAHAYDIFMKPANLREKLLEADVVTSGCRYNVDHLREVAGPEGAERIHEVVMGVDAQRFARRTPHPGEGPILAVGRLVEKKGFVHLVRAAARPELSAARVTIVGEGELRPRLEAEIERLGLGDRVELAGRRQQDEVRELLETAAVLAMPCVIAASGDRDSAPVVVKEALAMEVPVVTSDAVGLPELVRPEFGRLVPAGDEAALAAALAEVLALPAADLAAMGRAGREFVRRHADSRAEAAKLSALLFSPEAAPAGASAAQPA
jgi:colanic acid/amylovoran biosynthesis glycosyltransferase